MNYEYSTLVKANALDDEALSGPSNDQASIALLHAVGWMVKEAESSLERHQGGGWEMLSFDHILGGRRLLVSFLLRRERRASSTALGDSPAVHHRSRIHEQTRIAPFQACRVAWF